MNKDEIERQKRWAEIADLGAIFSGRTCTNEEMATLTELGRLKEAADNSTGANKNRAVFALKKFIDQHAELFKATEGLAAQLQAGLLLTGFGASGQLDTVAKECDLMREEMGYSTAPGVERTLIDNVVICWLRLMIAERHLTWAKTWKEETLYSDQVDRLSRRYTRAVESLARVRKMTRATKPLEVAHTGPRKLEAVG